MRKKVFITGSLLALFLLISSSTAFAQSLQLSSDEVATIKTEIHSGKPIKDVLKDHNISMHQIRTALGSTGIGKHRTKLSNTQISTIAAKLGLDATQVQAEIDAGKSLPEILKTHNITQDQIRQVFGEITGVKHGTKKHKNHR